MNIKLLTEHHFYNLGPVDIYNETSKVYLSYQVEGPIRIQRFNYTRITDSTEKHNCPQ